MQTSLAGTIVNLTCITETKPSSATPGCFTPPDGMAVIDYQRKLLQSLPDKAFPDT